MDGSGLPAAMRRLVSELASLPGIGEKNAIRLAFHIIFKTSKDKALRLSQAVRLARDEICVCETCFHFSSGGKCSICDSAGRDFSTVCVIEQPLDLIAIEQSGGYKGVYHVLHGFISPIDGIGPEDLKLREFIKRLQSDSRIKEVILATSSRIESVATSNFIAEILKKRADKFGIKIYRISQGIPAGSDIEHLDQTTLRNAIADRKEI
ncbi:MAG: recombination protein RecR [Candidatus Mycalebacterium zealandia]|nr:MAG: recombination protein RecR [Candidatus Mycalebacterium zealandia]